MYQRYFVSTLMVVLALVICLPNLQAQIMPPIVAPSIILKGAISDGGKVQLAWEVVTKDTVKYFRIYRAVYTGPTFLTVIFPDSLKFAMIDSVTNREYTDYPPRQNATSGFVYYVAGTTTKNTVLKSNYAYAIYVPPPPKTDIVKITSVPKEVAQINVPYLYQAKAISSDSSAVLSYGLNTKPNGMTIDASGLIKWTPVQRGQPVVEVTVKSTKGGSAIQRYTIRVAGGSGIVLGRVTDTMETKPIAGVALWLYKIDATASAVFYDYKAMSDASGDFKFEGVDPGVYYVRVEPANSEYLPQWYDRASTLRDAKTITVVNNASTLVNILLQARYKPTTFLVKGSVVDSANHGPLKGATVVFVTAGFALNGSRGFAADPTGAQDFRGLFDNNPVADHRLDGTNATFVFKTISDASGQYALQLPMGSYVAYAESRGHVKMFYKQQTNLLTADTIFVNANLSNINFNLPPVPAVPLGEINGMISDSATGTGVRSRVLAFRERWVTVTPLSPVAGTFVPNTYFVDTDSLGNYSISNVIPGEYFVLAVPVGSYAPAFYSSSGSTQSWTKASRVAVNGNVIAGIDITVKPFSKIIGGYTYVRGAVSASSSGGTLGKSAGSVGVEGAIVYAVNKDGSVYGYDVTDENGTYAITGVAPGSYTLFVDAPGFTSSPPVNASPTYATDLRGTPQPGSGVNFSLNSVTVTDVQPNVSSVPSGYVLEQNYPNPFNPSTQIFFSLPSNDRVTLTIYNLIGQKIATLVDGTMSAGAHVVTWNGRDSRGVQLPSGVYFYRLESAGFVAARRMLMLK